MISWAGFSRISGGREVSLAASSGSSTTWESSYLVFFLEVANPLKPIKRKDNKRKFTDSMAWKAEAPLLASRFWIIARANCEFRGMFTSFRAFIPALWDSSFSSPLLTSSDSPRILLAIWKGQNLKGGLTSQVISCADRSLLMVLVFLMKADTTTGDVISKEPLLRSSSFTPDPLRKVERAPKFKDSEQH